MRSQQLDPSFRKEKSCRLPNNRTLNVKCKDINEHWGVVWSNFQLLLASQAVDYLHNIPWNYTNLKFQLPHPSIHVSSFNIKLYPDYYQQKLHIQYDNSTLPRYHSRVLIEKFCMNQYLKSIPMKTSVLPSASDEIRLRSTRIPGYYIYNYGTNYIADIEYEDLVYTAHIPCMCAWDREEYPVITVTFLLCIPATLSITNNTFFWDIFHDTINQVFYEFQLHHLETFGKQQSYQYLTTSLITTIRHIDDYLLTAQTPQKRLPTLTLPPPTDFISTLITTHLVSYYTLIISDVPTESQFVYDICHLLDTPHAYNQPFSTPATLRVLLQPNPFFRSMCLTAVPPSLFTLPFPYTVVDVYNHKIFKSSSMSSIRYFIQRLNYFITNAASRLSLSFQRSLATPPPLVPALSSPIVFPFAEAISALFHENYEIYNNNSSSDNKNSLKINSNRVRILLEKMCDIFAMKARIASFICDKLIASERENIINFFCVARLKETLCCDSEALKAFLGVQKFANSYFMGEVIELLESFEKVLM
ncbi:UDENN domain-containing protein [Entamoeba marina]